jgi:hypothetical protein
MPPVVASAPTAFDDRIYRELFPPGDPDGEAWLAEFWEAADRLYGELAGLLSVETGTLLRRHDMEAVAHRLAGSAFSVGAVRSGDAARGLEWAALTEDLAALRERRRILRDELATAKSAMAAFLARKEPEPIS